MNRSSLCGLITATLLSACDNTPIEPDNPYGVMDSGFTAMGRGNSVWLDNHRVVFEGYAVKAPASLEEFRASEQGLYVWNTLTNDIELFASRGRDICYLDNYISYRIPSTDPNDPRPLVQQFDRIAGVPGSEVNETALKRQQGLELTDIIASRNVSCKNIAPPPLMVASGKRNYRNLLEGHGYLEVPPGLGPNHTEPFVLHSFDESRVIELPFTGTLWVSGMYFEFKNAYFIYRHSQHELLVGKTCGDGGWYWPDGAVESICIPLDYRWQSAGAVKIVPLKSGFFITMHKREYQGGYFTDQGKILHVTDGQLDQVSVSPDGCKVAFTYLTSFPAAQLRRDEVTMKMLDTCALQFTDTAEFLQPILQ